MPSTLTHVLTSRTDDAKRQTRLRFTRWAPGALALVLLSAVACGSDSNGSAETTGGPTTGTSASTGTTGMGTTGAATSGAGSAGGTSGGSSSTANGTTTTGTGAGSTTAGSSSGLTVTLSLSDVIGTVGIAEITSASALQSARIDFGRDASNFEFSATVDVTQPNARTLLLGMKEATTYYVQVSAESSGMTLTSDVLTLQTEVLANSLPSINVTDVNPSAIWGAFTIACTGVAARPGDQGSAGWAFIFDRDGDVVWAYDLSGTVADNCTRARMSYDGKDMWIGNFSNVSTDGALMRVSMDGLTTRDYSLPARHHDFTVLPNNNILYQEQANGGMGRGGADEGEDLIKELDVETGESRLIYDENTDFSEQIAESGAHTNYIEYVPHLNAISFSMRHTSTIGVISYPPPGEQAELLMTFGGPLSDFDFSWDYQHGHELLENSLLVFNNNAAGSPNESAAIEYQFDLNAGTGTQVLNYTSGNVSFAFGDVQRLPNGNTLVTFSTQGVIHEIDAQGNLLREISTDPIGYADHRKSLYGPPQLYVE